MSFFDLFGAMFDPDQDPRNRRPGRSDDDPVIIDVQEDGRAGARPSSGPVGGRRGPGGPHGPQLPRLNRRTNGMPGMSRGSKMLLAVLGALVLLLVLLFATSRFITDLMWYGQLGASRVVWTQLGVKFGLWLAYALILALITLASATLAIRARPDSPDGSTIRIKGDVIEIGNGVSSKAARRIAGVVSLVVGVVFGSQFNADWTRIILLFNRQSFGSRDPQFGLDNGFYVFTLPGLKLLASAFLLIVVLAGLFSLITHFLMGGVRLTMPVHGRGIVEMTRHARRQLAVWLILAMLAWAGNIALGVFDRLTEQGDQVAGAARITGASYTSVNANIPVTFIMAVLVALVGIVLGAWLLTAKTLGEGRPTAASAGAALKQWRLPVAAIGALVVAAVLLTGVWPMVVQRFRVSPNAQEMESKFIQRNISATSQAYGLKGLKTEQYQATTQVRSGALAQDADTTAQIRLLDPQVVSPTFRQLQQSKQYYSFEDTLAVDKYEIDGVSQDTVIGARELDLNGNDNRNWVNDHTVFTHGYGVVAAYGNKVTADGQPEFFEQDIPTHGKLTDQEHYEPRIYFSPNAPEYSIVGSADGTKTKGWEFDYPTGSNGATNTFVGHGGPSVGNFLSRLLYSIRFGSDQILFSDRVTPSSQILYDRSPKERVAKVAPYLTLDGRVYPAVVDGRVKWIVDGYTTSDMYPYSQKVDLGPITQDSTTVTSQAVKGLGSQSANYIRNSVKATVDAYDGSVDLYAWDAHDPVLKAWQKVFPGQYKPLSRISGDLMSHMRYPESLFKVQRQLLSQYHVGQANQFFSGEDFWQTPVDPTGSDAEQKSGVKQPPYYLTMQTPGTASPTFSLTSTYIPAGTSTREILTGFMSVDSDAGRTPGKIGADYGTLRLLELPKNSNVPGPGQAQNNFNSDAAISTELNLLQSGSTKVKRGNLLTLPVGNGLIYVQPVYVQSSGATSFPLLKRVLVAFGDKVSSAPTLDAALDKTFKGHSGASAGDAENAGKTDQTAVPGSDDGTEGRQPSKPGTGQAPAAPGGDGHALQQSLSDADQAMKDSDSALRKGDFTAYGEAQNRLKEALNKALESQKRG
ncbi:UPF0182 family membrane protein [Bifidobacterium xylocopae]|uniref:UPF0182 protein CRD59_00655 n=1 Tax=Bifidobacterium xylocopae TaxID=2493119 RepID=A0A366KE78_9BIFI|nr:UPF0182 family protein [Bifidobacterium xylocopae]RBQ00011.1 hypothetical protein CRD59_00655 [Bifidobacterium xylocopae]